MNLSPLFRKYQQWWMLTSLIILAVFFRTLYYSESFNFSSDQAAFSITAFNQLKDQELALQGPPFSFHIGERRVAQGPVIYYLQTIFLVIGQFDPLYASLAFTMLSCLMLIPLYIGTKLLMGQKAAWWLCVFFALTPFYITYTKFLWNPNYQLAFLPLLILAMGLYHQFNSAKFFFVIGFLTFFLLQLHYQFFICLVVLISYYLMNKTSLIQWLLFFVGGFVAYGPFLYYELTHKWYNTETLWFFLTHRDILFAQNKDQSSFAPHYFLSLSFFGLFLITYYLKEYLTKQLLTSVLLILLLISGFQFLPVPKGAYGMAEKWNYLDEVKIHQIVMEQKLDSFNLTNLEYDSLYQVQKYLLLKNNIQFDSNNYHSYINPISY
jgi:4-amino-4-deoxy-L-arabinose transferase-like glycosyltransferase